MGARVYTSKLSMFFASPDTATPASGQVIVENRGNRELNVSDVTVGHGRFTVNPKVITLAAGALIPITVTYTPEGVSAVSDSLWVLSNDPMNPSFGLALKAQETPVNISNAVVTLEQTGGSPTPAAGDSVLVLLMLEPSGDNVTGIEVFLGFNASLLSTPSIDPVREAGLSVDPPFLVNRVEGVGPDAAVRFAVLFEETVTATDTLAIVGFEVTGTSEAVRRLRLLNEAPLRNSQITTAANASFSLRSGNRIELGNTLPEIVSFPLVSVSEDDTATVTLGPFVLDRETAADDLAWDFTDVDGLGMTASLPDALSARFYAPPEQFGFYRMLATVADPGGAADTVFVLLDVLPTNDAPTAPVYTSPANQSTALEAPIQFTWSTSTDPDEGDEVRYDFLIGLDQANLSPFQANLAGTSFVWPGGLADQTYFWQIVATDGKADGRKEGPVFQLTTALDQVAPVFVEVPASTEGSTTQTTAQLTWTTNEQSDHLVRVGTMSNLAEIVSETSDSTQGQPQYNPDADFGGAGVIDFTDFVRFAVLFGTVYTP